MYRWNEREIRLKRILCRLLRKPDFFFNHYTTILNQLDVSKSTFNPEEVLISSDSLNIDYNQALAKFRTGLEYIDEEIYSALIELYFSFGAYVKYGERPEFSRMFLSDDDLINIVHDMIANLGIIEYDKIYKKIISKRRHILNIQHTYESELVEDLSGLRGIALKDPLFKKSYINIFRSDTVEDIEVLFHETMHAIYYELLFDSTKFGTTLLHELEGQFGSLYVYDYLQFLGLKKEALDLKRDFLDNILLSIHLLVLNHALHATALNHDFNIGEAEKMIQESLIGKTVTISPEELPRIVDFYGYESVTTIIASLVALEVMEKNIDIQDKFRLLHQLRENDGENLTENIEKHDVDFRKDSFRTLRKVHTELQR